MQTTTKQPSYASVVARTMAKPAVPGVAVQLPPAQPAELRYARAVTNPVAKPTEPAVATQTATAKPGRISYAQIVATPVAQPPKPAMAKNSSMVPIAAKPPHGQKTSRWSSKAGPASRHATRGGRAQEQIPEAVKAKMAHLASCKPVAMHSISQAKGAAQKPGPPPPASPTASETPKAASAGPAPQSSCPNSAPSSDAGSSSLASPPPTRRPSYASVASMASQPTLQADAPGVGKTLVKPPARAAASSASCIQPMRTEAEAVSTADCINALVDNINNLL